MLWTVPRDWAGETAFIVAGGPSVARQDVAPLRDRRVIVINSSFRLLPGADYLVFNDTRWWRENHADFPIFRGRIVSTAPCIPRGDILRLRKIDPEAGGLASDPSEIVVGRTSTQAAINLAVHLGAARLVLLGVDMQPDGARTHHHAPHCWPQKPNCWDEQMQHLRLTVEPLQKMGIDVINTSLASRIDWWPKRPLEDCL